MKEEKNNNESEIINKCVYTVELNLHADGTHSINRTNKGFNVFELIGMLSMIKEDLIKQLENPVNYD